MSKYNENMKMSLRDKIESIDDKDTLLEIFNIITKNNTNLSYSENSKGVFLKFNSLSQQTYKDLDVYLKKVGKKIQKSKIKDIKSYTTDDDIRNTGYSNAEKTLIKRKKYDDTMSSEDDVIYQKFTVDST